MRLGFFFSKFVNYKFQKNLKIILDVDNDVIYQCANLNSKYVIFGATQRNKSDCFRV
jgi:hypothetical protein